MTTPGNRVLLGFAGLSLAANLFLAGMMLGQVRPMPMLDHDRGGHPGPMGMMEDMENALPPADAAVFHRVMSKGMPPRPAEPPQDLQAVQRALTAPQFDAEAFHRALQRVHDDHNAMDVQFVQALTEAVSQISPEGRVKLAAALARGPGPGDGPRDGFGPPPPGPDRDR
jgi:uncharacterized membrane protein